MTDGSDTSQVNRVHFTPVDILTSFSGRAAASSSHDEPTTPKASPPLRLLSTPSPTNSLSTVSTNGPITPPPNVKPDPNSPTALPGIAVHHTLTAPTSIAWDVSLDPTEDAAVPNLKNIGDKAAICNNGHPLKGMRVRLPAIGVAVDIHGSKSRVTIRDVLRGIYDELQNAPRQEIWTNISRDLRGAVGAVYRKRSPGEEDWVRYIDFLGPNLKFEGLQPIEGNSKEWDVLFGPVARS